MNELRAQFDAGKDVDLSKAPPLPLLLRLSSVMCSSLLYLQLYQSEFLIQIRRIRTWWLLC
jgi:hypothetical protein